MDCKNNLYLATKAKRSVWLIKLSQEFFTIQITCEVRERERDRGNERGRGKEREGDNVQKLTQVPFEMKTVQL